MQNSKVYSILQYFDKYQQNSLRKYIVSPYFNKHEVLIQLFEIFIQHINENSESSLEKEGIWANLIPDMAFDDVRFRKLSSDLLKLVESYLAQQVYEENPLHQATYLIEAVGNYNMEKLYKSSMRTARRLSKQQLFKPANYYFYQYQIERNFYDIQNSELRRESITNYEAIISNLDSFFLAEKLRWYSSMLSRLKVVNYEYNLLFIDEIIDHLKKHNYDEIPAVAIYYQIYLTQNDAENESHYFKLKDLIEKHSLLFPINEANEIYSHAINYCISKINQGRDMFLIEFLEVNEDLLRKNILIDDELSPWKFQNIVVVALRVGKYEWTENFINTYKDKIPEAYRENAVTFNIARLYFFQKKFENVISLLHAVEYEDVSYNLGSKGLLLQAYYEMDEIEPLYSLMDAFRTYLNRHKDIPQKRRKNYFNLISFIKKMSNTIPGDKEAVKKLKTNFEKLDGIAASKSWVLEKIAELE
jgi:hypothetical protein